MHESVLPHEAIDYLDIKSNGIYADLTGGFGGHSQLILDQLDSEGKLYIIDRDDEALKYLHQKFDSVGNVEILKNSFADQVEKFAEDKIKLDGILVDLGISSIQLDSETRGFGFKQDGPLDMRMDQSSSLTAQDIVNEFSFDELVEILFEYGEERFAKRISGFICEYREKEEIKTVFELVKVIQDAVGVFYRKQRIHPATRTFQALRIAVNQELDQLDKLLKFLPSILKEQGRAVIISFHSLEDRRVKIVFREYKKELGWKVLTKKPLIPTEEELNRNSRSRSAKLRAIERV